MGLKSRIVGVKRKADEAVGAVPYARCCFAVWDCRGIPGFGKKVAGMFSLVPWHGSSHSVREMVLAEAAGA